MNVHYHQPAGRCRVDKRDELRVATKSIYPKIDRGFEKRAQERFAAAPISFTKKPDQIRDDKQLGRDVEMELARNKHGEPNPQNWHPWLDIQFDDQRDSVHCGPFWSYSRCR